MRVFRSLSAALACLALSGCDESPSDGAPVETEVSANPLPDLNPQGLFRSGGGESED